MRTMFTFAIVVLFAPKEERRERIDWICELVRPEDTFVVGAVLPFRTMFTFAIVVLFAPNEDRSESVDWICVLVRPEDAVVVVVVVVVGDVAVTTPPDVRAMFTFAIVVLFAPNDARSERID
jgi:hypothetical protein